MNKKGSLVLRDLIFMMMIMSSIIILAGFFVTDMASNYDNTNMSSEWSGIGMNTSSNTLFDDTYSNVSSTGESLREDTGIFSFLSSKLEGIGSTLFMVLTAPTTVANFIAGIAESAGSPVLIVTLIKILLNTILWGVVIFTIISAFTPGGGKF